MPKPCVSYTQVIVPRKVIELEVVVIFVQPLFGKGNTVGPDQVGATFATLAGLSVCIHKYDLCVHLVMVRKGLREGGVEVLPIFGRSI